MGIDIESKIDLNPWGFFKNRRLKKCGRELQPENDRLK